MVRASEFKHPVQGDSSDGDFRGLGLISSRSQGIADHAFVSTDRCLDLGPKIVATRLLPAHPTVRDDLLEVSVALCRSARDGRTRNRGGSRRYDDRGIRMTLGDSLVNSVLIVRAVSREGRQGIGELVEQRGSPRGVVALLVSSIATISPLSPSRPICSLRHDRRRDVPCFSTSHSPAPPSFRPVLSTSKCSGPAPSRRRGARPASCSDGSMSSDPAR
jgi:hypothetical protein